MSKPLTTSQVIERLATAAEAGGRTLSRPTFEQSILPLMEERGDAWKFGDGRRGQWLIDAGSLWMWEVYVQRRAELITTGEWHGTRAYSIADMEDIALLDAYE